MNLCILISSLNIGGAEKQAVNDANLLCSKNNVLLVVFKDGLLKTNLDERIKYIVIDKSGYYNAARELATLIVTYKIDVIHASLFASMIIGVLASKISQKPILWNFHSHEHDLPIKSRLTLLVLSRSSLLKRISYVNNELRIFLEKKLWIPQSKGVVLYNNSEFEPNTIFTKKNNERLIIGYVGRIVELKRVEYFIDVAQFLIQQKIFNFCIHVVGDGDMRLDIENRISEMRMDSYFVFHGFQTDLEYFYNYFDVFINPSREECLSIALIDAGMKGIPSIAFDVGGNNEIIVHNESGYIVKCREELFVSLYRLINQPELRNTMGEKAAVHCKNMFSKQERLIKLNMLFDFDER